MDTRIQKMLEDEMKEQTYPDFEAGDTIRIRTREDIGGQMRPRTFEGVCIGCEGEGPNQTFKVRKTSFGVGIERIFPLYSPIIQDIEIVRKGKVRRSKLTYLEGRSQKDSRIKQQRVDLEEINRVEGTESKEGESSDDISEPSREETSADSSQETTDSAEEIEASHAEKESEQDPSENQADDSVESTSPADDSSPEESGEVAGSEQQEIPQEEENKEEVGESV